jgi:hypothetical protein
MAWLETGAAVGVGVTAASRQPASQKIRTKKRELRGTRGNCGELKKKIFSRTERITDKRETKVRDPFRP